MGMTCSSVNFGEEELEAVSAQVLGMDRFDGEAFEEQVREVTVLKDGNLQFRFSDGGTKVWKNLRLHQAWHEATVTDCFQGKIRCAICGNTYHRVNSGGRWVYWYCIGKKRSNVECHNVNYADFKLRRISASILGLEEFDEAEFERQIEEIVALEDGSLEYHFREGRTQIWQKM